MSTSFQTELRLQKPSQLWQPPHHLLLPHELRVAGVLRVSCMNKPRRESGGVLVQGNSGFIRHTNVSFATIASWAAGTSHRAFAKRYGLDNMLA
mmetsp:Transcript_71883/g.119660  ORF Transcript_71883/g.119660 Transcript_71883/m.119660 type:complete len:94 (+) Transcript_71883:95-376(+)